MSAKHNNSRARAVAAPLVQPRFRLAGSLLLAMLAAALLFAQTAALAADGHNVMERLEPSYTPGESRLNVRFNLPMRFVSLKASDDGKLLQVIVQPVPVSGFDTAELAVTEVLGWQPSTAMPLERVTYDGEQFVSAVIDDLSNRAPQATLVLQFAEPINSYQLLDDADFRGFTLVLPYNGPAPAATAVVAPKPRPVAAPSAPTAASRDALPATEQQEQGLQLARDAMTEGDVRRAIRLLTALVEAPEHTLSADSLELLGLARERNSQLAHANTAYEQYLERYPEGEGAERVRQRLAALSTAAQQPRQPLRRAKREEENEWDVFGSVAQYYRREGVDTDVAGTETTLSELDSSLVFSARRRTAENDLRIQFTGSQSNDFLDEQDESRISEMYVDWFDRSAGYSLKAGRQRHNSSGTLSRFDGLLAGYRFTPEVRVNAVYGRPVESSSDTFINKDKQFYGLSTELGTFADHWDLSAFAIQQEADGYVDRRAIGGEVRYFDDRRSLFSVIDYDILFSELNTVLLLGNWTFENNTTAYVNLDYRNSPALTTSNALTGQTATSIAELEQTYTLDEIRDFALDRTQRARLFSLGGSRPLSENLQVSGDVTVSNLQETETSAGVDAVPGTDNEYYYTAQLIRSNLLKQGDVGIVGLQYADGSLYDTITLNLNSRYPLSQDWRISPRLKIARRENDSDGSTRLSLSPFMRLEYRLRRELGFEMELGASYHNEDQSAAASQEYGDYHFSLGYRWDY